MSYLWARWRQAERKAHNKYDINRIGKIVPSRVI
jgi:hypothetical protein